jgi:hypothetical protein
VAMVLSMAVFVAVMSIDDMYARRYVRKHGIEKKVN